MSLLQLMLLTVLTVMTVLSALMVVSVRNLIHAGFWLLPFFLGIGGFYLILSLEFLFALQLLLYAGAVMVVVLFALMLTRDVMNPKVRQTNRLQVAAIASSASMMTFLIIVIYRHSAAFTTVPGEVNPDTITRQLGAMLLNEYVLPFELTSALLLSAMLGAIFLARSPKVEITPEEVQEEAADESREPAASLLRAP
ncbi:MAG: NADH-quinone oxidoreductase subunit J [Armatimonadota bacterium]|nr:NADH-quinone oxidoreductase subunit J [Armatimonadota bacterium]MDW8290274.1 NADH-quinone oxidoreductase subunit J [Armatimonadota bacterium]